jgi:hypothetical protein
MVRSLLRSTAKYLIFCLAVMLVQLSVLTGKFPPPVNESIQAVQSFQETLDPKNLQQMKEQARARQGFIDSIGTDNLIENFEVPLRSPVEAEVSEADLQKEIKNLKYENMVLRSRLDNCDPSQVNQ